jgi:hypothetical protein
MNLSTEQRQAQFLGAYSRALAHALAIVRKRELEGENTIVPLPDMFPHGTSDLTFMLHTKVSRILGYEAAGDLDRTRGEVYDLINYAGFLIAMMDVRDEQSPGELGLRLDMGEPLERRPE